MNSVGVVNRVSHELPHGEGNRVNRVCRVNGVSMVWLISGISGVSRYVWLLQFSFHPLKAGSRK